MTSSTRNNASAIFFTTDRTVGRDPQMLCRALGIRAERFARPHQTHSDRILRVSEDFFSLPADERTALMHGIDAVISDVPEACLGVSTADCIPVIIYDPEHHAAAAVHAGWRGTVQRIASKAVAAMSEAYSTDPAQCHAIIGPGISLDSFEVGDEVYDAFAEAGFPMAEAASRYPALTATGEKWHIDLKKINALQLRDCGIDEQNISISPIDTFTDTSFFSARREQRGDEKCGRIFTGFVLSNWSKLNS